MAIENLQDYRILQKPFYLPVGDEVEVFEQAWAEQIPLLHKGPTGCGKTRFVEYMVYNLGLKLSKITQDKEGSSMSKSTSTMGVGCLYTVACHEDLTARDLTGRYIMKGGEAVRIDGPAAQQAASIRLKTFEFDLKKITFSGRHIVKNIKETWAIHASNRLYQRLLRHL